MTADPIQPLLSEFRDDPDMTELVESFVQELPARVATLAACLEQNQLADLQRIAHQLKGASGGYGFPVLGEAAARVESLLKSGAETGSVMASVKELIALCQRVRMG